MTVTLQNDLLIRILKDRDVDLYASHLSDGALEGAIELPPEIDFSSLSETRGKWTVIGKVLWVKRWFRSENALFPKGVNLHLPLWSKYGCHMDDAGNVTLPLSVFRRRLDPFVKYVFHESAHLYLSSSDEYESLLALDKLFLERYGDRGDAICLTPIEYFASLLSIRLLERAAAYLGEERTATRLLMQKSLEERKLSRAISAFGREN